MMKRNRSTVFLLLLLSILGLQRFPLGSAAAAPPSPPCIHHDFVSAKSDPGDTTLIKPSDWNACLDIDDAAISSAKLSATIDFSGKTATMPVKVTTTAAAPATCTANKELLIKSDATTGQKLFICNSTGNGWDLLGDGAASESDTLATVFARGKSTTGANSLVNAMRVGDGTNQWCIYRDSAAGLQFIPCTAANTATTIMTNQTWSLYDQEADAAIETVDPDAATVKGMWTYGVAYRPLKSIWFGAGALSTDGTQCAAPAEVTINSGAKRWTIICADNDGSTIYGEVVMPDSWDAGTVTFEGSFIQTAADTNAMNSDIAAACRTPGDAINNTWGTEIAMDITNMGGSNKLDQASTTAVTPNGTCHGGDLLQFRWQLDATGTTTGVSTLHVLGFKMVYSVTSRSD